MKALTLHQPWASLIALGVKTIETRSWATSYRGPIAIHAGKARPVQVEKGFLLAEYCTPFAEPYSRWALLGAAEDHGPYPLALGAVVATARLVDCVPMVSTSWSTQNPQLEIAASGRLVHWRSSIDTTDATDQLPYGWFEPGRFAWLLADVVALDEPVPARGAQGLWEWTP